MRRCLAASYAALSLLLTRPPLCLSPVCSRTVNAGATFVDEAVVIDGPIITSRTPADLTPFVHAIIDLTARGVEVN